MASISSYIAQPNCITYALTKTAMLSLTRNSALDLYKLKGIRVNSICPGTIYTKASELEMEKQHWNRQEWEQIKSREWIEHRRTFSTCSSSFLRRSL